MKELFSLGELYVSDFISDNQSAHSKIEMKMMLEETTGAVRLEKCAPLDTMYGKYWYRSGINQTMKNELKNIVESVYKIYQLQENDIWIDIACNDGTLLSHIPNNIIKIGIDPADNSYKNESEKHSNLIIQDYFSYKVYKQSKFGLQPAKVITSIAMFYDLEDPNIFLQDISNTLDDNGLWVLQLSYTPLMLKQMAFDNICHEHIYYYSLFNIKRLFENNGFKIMDCQLNDINGGSFRLYVMKQNADETRFGTQPYRDVCNFRIESLLKYEETLNLESSETWNTFYNNILKLKNKVISFIQEQKKAGKKIWAYGASTKGNTLLQFFNLDNSLIEGIAERSHFKWGLKTIGTNIPIYSEDTMRKLKPDYLLILPWHFIDEFIKRENKYLMDGGKFIIPCPEFKIIGK